MVTFTPDNFRPGTLTLGGVKCSDVVSEMDLYGVMLVFRWLKVLIC